MPLSTWLAPSSAASSPVTARTFGGSTCATSSRRSVWETPGFAVTQMLVNACLPFRNSFCAVRRSKIVRVAPASDVLSAYPARPTSRLVEHRLAGRRDDRDLLADVVAALLGGLLVEHDLVRPVGWLAVEEREPRDPVTGGCVAVADAVRRGAEAADDLAVLADDEDPDRLDVAVGARRAGHLRQLLRPATRGTVRVDGSPFRVALPCGRTTTSPTEEPNSRLKPSLSAAENTSEPTTNATPSAIANVLMSSRTLRASRLFQAARIIGSRSPKARRPPSRRSPGRDRDRGSRRRSRPSDRKTTRSVYAAATGSWVTITTVWSWSSTLRRRSSRISAPDLLSRLPVGSSANTICGRPTSARATATRCCWPPDSSCGLWVSRSRRPTVSMTSSYHCASGLRPAIAWGSRMFSSALRVGIRL